MKANALCLVLVSATALGQERVVDRRVDADPEGQLEISLYAGDIVVQAWDENAVRVSGELGESVERLELDTDGGRTVMRVVPRNRGGRSGRETWRDDTDLLVRAPAGMALFLDTVSADVAVRGIEGEQQISGVSGDIYTEVFSAEVRVQAVSGDIDLKGRGTSRYARASAVSGDLSLQNLGGELLAESVSGDIEVFGGIFDRAELKSVSGDVVFAADLNDGARLDAMATSGDIELQFEREIPGNYRLSTFSGDLDNCFGPRPRGDDNGRTPGRELRFDRGASRTRILARTHSGDVDVCGP